MILVVAVPAVEGAGVTTFENFAASRNITISWRSNGSSFSGTTISQPTPLITVFPINTTTVIVRNITFAFGAWLILELQTLFLGSTSGGPLFLNDTASPVNGSSRTLNPQGAPVVTVLFDNLTFQVGALISIVGLNTTQYDSVTSIPGVNATNLMAPNVTISHVVFSAGSIIMTRGCFPAPGTVIHISRVTMSFVFAGPLPFSFFSSFTFAGSPASGPLVIGSLHLRQYSELVVQNCTFYLSSQLGLTNPSIAVFAVGLGGSSITLEHHSRLRIESTTSTLLDSTPQVMASNFIAASTTLVLLNNSEILIDRFTALTSVGNLAAGVVFWDSQLFASVNSSFAIKRSTFAAGSVYSSAYCFYVGRSTTVVLQSGSTLAIDDTLLSASVIASGNEAADVIFDASSRTIALYDVGTSIRLLRVVAFADALGAQTVASTNIALRCSLGVYRGASVTIQSVLLNASAAPAATAAVAVSIALYRASLTLAQWSTFELVEVECITTGTSSRTTSANLQVLASTITIFQSSTLLFFNCTMVGALLNVVVSSSTISVGGGGAVEMTLSALSCGGGGVGNAPTGLPVANVFVSSSNISLVEGDPALSIEHTTFSVVTASSSSLAANILLLQTLLIIGQGARLYLNGITCVCQTTNVSAYNILVLDNSKMLLSQSSGLEIQDTVMRASSVAADSRNVYFQNTSITLIDDSWVTISGTTSWESLSMSADASRVVTNWELVEVILVLVASSQWFVEGDPTFLAVGSRNASAVNVFLRLNTVVSVTMASTMAWNDLEASASSTAGTLTANFRVESSRIQADVDGAVLASGLRLVSECHESNGVAFSLHFLSSSVVVENDSGISVTSITALAIAANPCNVYAYSAVSLSVLQNSTVYLNDIAMTAECTSSVAQSSAFNIRMGGVTETVDMNSNILWEVCEFRCVSTNGYAVNFQIDLPALNVLYSSSITYLECVFLANSTFSSATTLAPGNSPSAAAQTLGFVANVVTSRPISATVANSSLLMYSQCEFYVVAIVPLVLETTSTTAAHFVFQTSGLFIYSDALLLSDDSQLIHERSLFQLALINATSMKTPRFTTTPIGGSNYIASACFFLSTGTVTLSRGSTWTFQSNTISGNVAAVVLLQGGDLWILDYSFVFVVDLLVLSSGSTNGFPSSVPSWPVLDENHTGSVIQGFVFVVQLSIDRVYGGNIAMMQHSSLYLALLTLDHNTVTGFVDVAASNGLLVEAFSTFVVADSTTVVVLDVASPLLVATTTMAVVLRVAGSVVLKSPNATVQISNVTARFFTSSNNNTTTNSIGMQVQQFPLIAVASTGQWAQLDTCTVNVSCDNAYEYSSTHRLYVSARHLSWQFVNLSKAGTASVRSSLRLCRGFTQTPSASRPSRTISRSSAISSATATRLRSQSRHPSSTKSHSTSYVTATSHITLSEVPLSWTAGKSHAGNRSSLTLSVTWTVPPFTNTRATEVPTATLPSTVSLSLTNTILPLVASVNALALSAPSQWTATAAGALVSAGGGAVAVQSALLSVRFLSCETLLSLPSDVSSNPTRLVVGEDEQQYQRGVLLGNALLVFLLAVVTVGLMFVVWTLQRRQRQGDKLSSSSLSRKSLSSGGGAFRDELRKVSGTLRLPGRLSTIWIFLLQPTLAAALCLLMRPAHAWDVVVSVLAGAIIAAVLALEVMEVTTRFRARWRRRRAGESSPLVQSWKRSVVARSSRRPQSGNNNNNNNTLSPASRPGLTPPAWLRYLVWLLEPIVPGQWIDLPAGGHLPQSNTDGAAARHGGSAHHHFVARFGPLFQRFGPRRHWFAGVDRAVGVLEALSLGVAMAFPSACGAMRWCAAGVELLFFLAVAAANPMSTRASAAVSLLVAGSNAAAAVCVGLIDDCASCANVSVALVQLSVAMSVVRFVTSRIPDALTAYFTAQYETQRGNGGNRTGDDARTSRSEATAEVLGDFWLDDSDRDDTNQLQRRPKRNGSTTGTLSPHQRRAELSQRAQQQRLYMLIARICAASRTKTTIATSM